RKSRTRKKKENPAAVGDEPGASKTPKSESKKFYADDGTPLRLDEKKKVWVPVSETKTSARTTPKPEMSTPKLSNKSPPKLWGRYAAALGGASKSAAPAARRHSLSSADKGTPRIVGSANTAASEKSSVPPASAEPAPIVFDAISFPDIQTA